MLFRSEGLRVAVVRNSKANVVPITVERDYESLIRSIDLLFKAVQLRIAEHFPAVSA